MLTSKALQVAVKELYKAQIVNGTGCPMVSLRQSCWALKKIDSFKDLLHNLLRRYKPTVEVEVDVEVTKLPLQTVTVNTEHQSNTSSLSGAKDAEAGGANITRKKGGRPKGTT
jgi:hypothetical protein